ncbi:hypothetical protein [Streptomyces sp. JJ38]|uniref:hypothetical protein n=1 Tax=Streptomyces sp. JJ38 TaxID=2738128 RepID=UPI001C5A4508|nr:hypothetical protein [Streptomyces sp. JJ38]MBW1598671.1 hypothetical protein [Streptomyces sp. JJ38]
MTTPFCDDLATPHSSTDAHAAAGPDWPAAASPFPRSVRALWAAFPERAQPLPCGTVFDAVSAPAVFGRRMAEQLAGAGPVAVQQGRVLFLAAPGTARRLPALLRWEEWQGRHDVERIPPLLGYGPGDVVPVPAPPLPGEGAGAAGSRWLVPPTPHGGRLPGPRDLLWAAVRAVRAGREGGRGLSISARGDAGVKVYDVSRRR